MKKKGGKSISGPSDHAPPRLINRSKSAIHTTRVEKELQKPAPIHGFYCICSSILVGLM